MIKMIKRRKNPAQERALTILSLLFVPFIPLIVAGECRAYESQPVDNGGSLSGHVKFKGETPVLQPHKVVHNPEYCGDFVPDESFLVNPVNHGQKNITVSIEGITRGKKHDPEVLLIENSKCRFQPHTLAAMVGDSYEVKNSDPILHNTHMKMDDLTVLNVAMPANGKAIRKPLNQAGLIAIRCDAHTFMNSTLMVFDHPYFAVSDEDGFYKISEIPPGKYSVKFWRDGQLIKEKEVNISPRENANLSIEVSAK